MKFTRKEIFTIPNTLTAVRLAASPIVAKRLYKNPESWPLGAAFAISDNFDGMLARLGDSSPRLAELGFRRSEIGRKLDPLADKIFTSEVLVAGLLNGTIPKWLGGLSLAQKAAVSAVTLHNEARQAEVAVTRLGKYSEFATNLAIGTLFIAESLAEDSRRRQLRTAALALGALGFSGASLAAYGYHRTGERLVRDQAIAVAGPEA